MLRYDDGGLRNVWLANGYELRKTAYGKAVSFHDVHGLTLAICRALTKKPGRLTGPEFRYLRLHLRLSQASLGTIVRPACTTALPLYRSTALRLYRSTSP